MKNRILLGLIIFCSAIQIQSMVELGINGGINVSRFYDAHIQLPYTGKESADYTFGMDMYPFISTEQESSDQKIFFRTGMYFLRQSNHYHIQPEKGNNITLQSSLFYLRFPIALEYNLISGSTFKEKIYAGGYLAFNLKVRAINYRVLDLENILTVKRPEDYEMFNTIETKRDSTEFGISCGLRTELKQESGTIVFDIGYSRSLDSIRHSLLPINQHRNQCWMLTVGYRFD